MNDSAATTAEAAEITGSHTNQSYAPHLALVLVQMTFGSLPVVGKVVLKVVPSFAVVGFRVGTTALALLLVQALRGDLRLERRGDYGRFAVLSFFGVTLNQLLSISGLSLTRASNASLLAATIPIFALTVGSVFGIERLRWTAVFGILVAAAGVVLLIDPRNASFSSETTLGDVMIILNSLSYGIYVVFSKDVITRNGALKSTAWVFIFASLICVPLGLHSFSAIDLAGVGSIIWLALLYIALVATLLPYLLNSWALARVNPSLVAVYIYLQPLFGLIMAVVFLGEKVTALTIFAALLIFSGVFLVTRKRKLAIAESHITGG